MSIINSGVQALESRGIDLQRLQTLWGFKLASLRQPHLRLPAFLARRFWEVARELSGDPAIGLAAARQYDPGQMLGVSYLMQMMPSRLASLQVLASYWPLLVGHMTLACEERAGALHVALLVDQPLQPAIEELDFWAALQVQHLKGMPGTTPAIRELRMCRARPADPAPWQELAVDTLVFGAERNEVVLDMAALREPRPAGSPAVCTALAAALEYYAEQTARPSVLEAVANELLAGMARTPGLEQTAERLHMTSRTLHRALQREGWSFNAILDRQRRYLAHDLLIVGARGVGEVAESLGYRELQNFSRAFRRWYGASPRQVLNEPGCEREMEQLSPKAP